MDEQDIKNLKRRYLIWLYKTTKEAFDKFERKFTQLEIDKFILSQMEKELKEAYLPHEKEAIGKHVNDFLNYIDEKEKACLRLKYKNKKTNPEFLFLDLKLQAVEKAIIQELGKPALAEIKALYEKEMFERILNSTETK
jgi:CRISPR/Cas system CMR-associated protein Cmr5 small subunit